MYCRSSKRRLEAVAAPGAAVTAAAAELLPLCAIVAEPSEPSERSWAQGSGGGGYRWGLQAGVTGQEQRVCKGEDEGLWKDSAAGAAAPDRTSCDEGDLWAL